MIKCWGLQACSGGLCGLVCLQWPWYSFKLPQVGLKMAQDGLEMASKWLKLASRWPQAGSSWTQVGSKLPQVGPKLNQLLLNFSLSWLQVGSSWWTWIPSCGVWAVYTSRVGCVSRCRPTRGGFVFLGKGPYLHLTKKYNLHYWPYFEA